jgi:hypothetical protein
MFLIVAGFLAGSCNGPLNNKSDAECADSLQARELELRQQDSLNASASAPENETGGGFGYDLLSGGTTLIHQPHIPAINGMKGFATREDAEKVAGLMLYKVKNGIMPPTISIEEMDSLKIVK